MTRYKLAAYMGCALAFATIGATVHADQIGSMINAAMAAAGPSIVSIRAVNALTAQATGQPSHEQDLTSTLRGVIISSDGLVMCSNAYFSSDRIKEATGIPADQTSISISLASKDIDVTVGDSDTPYHATLAAQDSTLGLAFLQIRDLGTTTLPYVDLSGPGSVPNVGDPTASVTRLGSENDYALFGIEDRICGLLNKPRRGYIPEGYPGSLGLPVYGPDGSVIGVVSLLATSTVPADHQAESLARLFDDEESIAHSQYIVPVSLVSPLIALAKARAAALPPYVAAPVAAPAPVAKPAAPALPPIESH